MANLTVAEKTHWRDRSRPGSTAGSRRSPPAIRASWSGSSTKPGPGLGSLGLAGYQEELDRIAGQRAELDRRDTQIRKEMLAKVRGVWPTISTVTAACMTTRKSGGHRQAADAS